MRLLKCRDSAEFGSSSGLVSGKDSGKDPGMCSGEVSCMYSGESSGIGLPVTNETESKYEFQAILVIR